MASTLPDSRLVLPLHGVSYDFYEQVRKAPANRLLRMTYHNGTLEIMSPQYRHEKPSRRIGLDRPGRDVRAGHSLPGNGLDDVRPPGSEAAPGMGQGARPELLPGPRAADPRQGRDRPGGRSPAGPLDRGGPPGQLARPPAALRGPRRPGSLALSGETGRLWFGRRQDDTYVHDRTQPGPAHAHPQLVLEALRLGEDLSESEWDLILRDWVRANLAGV